MRNGDWFVILLVSGVLILWGGSLFRRWLEDAPKKRRFSIPEGEEDIESNEVTELLEGAGFDVLSAKVRIPIAMTLNDGEEYQSRLYIDYLVEKQDELYAVKVARDRKPLEMTGSAIREALLPYYLIVPDAAGVLYVDIHAGKIKKFKFDIEV